MNLTKEEQKLYKLTQCNTILNRDMLDKREAYLKNVAFEYKDIYGSKGVKFFNDMQKCNKSRYNLRIIQSIVEINLLFKKRALYFFKFIFEGYIY